MLNGVSVHRVDCWSTHKAPSIFHPWIKHPCGVARKRLLLLCVGIMWISRMTCKRSKGMGAHLARATQTNLYSRDRVFQQRYFDYGSASVTFFKLNALVAYTETDISWWWCCTSQPFGEGRVWTSHTIWWSRKQDLVGRSVGSHWQIRVVPQVPRWIELNVRAIVWHADCVFGRHDHSLV